MFRISVMMNLLICPIPVSLGMINVMQCNATTQNGFRANYIDVSTFYNRLNKASRTKSNNDHGRNMIYASMRWYEHFMGEMQKKRNELAIEKTLAVQI